MIIGEVRVLVGRHGAAAMAAKTAGYLRKWVIATSGGQVVAGLNLSADLENQLVRGCVRANREPPSPYPSGVCRSLSIEDVASTATARVRELSAADDARTT